MKHVLLPIRPFPRSRTSEDSARNTTHQASQGFRTPWRKIALHGGVVRAHMSWSQQVCGKMNPEGLIQSGEVPFIYSLLQPHEWWSCGTLGALQSHLLALWNFISVCCSGEWASYLGPQKLTGFRLHLPVPNIQRCGQWTWNTAS